MNEIKLGQSFATWLSTYGVLTATNLLKRFDITMPHEQLVVLLKQENNAVHQVLRPPMMNIFNGIVLQQAYDYQVYAQKLLIDYRLSAEFAKDSEAPGFSIRQELEELYQQVLEQGKQFSDQQLLHYRLISESQSWLISKLKGVNNLSEEASKLLKAPGSVQFLNDLSSRADELMISFRGYRLQFYNIILRLTERLKTLPNYAFNVEKMATELEALSFDAQIGGL